VISADGHPDLTRYEQGQNTVDWANRKLVDVILKMDYRPSIDFAAMDTVRSRMANPEALALLISNMAHGTDLPPQQKPFARSGRWLADTIATVFKRYPETGIAVYFYKYLSDEQLNALRTGPFNPQNGPSARLQPPVVIIR
jgi:hypothetical protein